MIGLSFHLCFPFFFTSSLCTIWELVSMMIFSKFLFLSNSRPNFNVNASVIFGDSECTQTCAINQCPYTISNNNPKSSFPYLKIKSPITVKFQPMFLKFLLSDLNWVSLWQFGLTLISFSTIHHRLRRNLYLSYSLPNINLFPLHNSFTPHFPYIPSCIANSNQ